MLQVDTVEGCISEGAVAGDTRREELQKLGPLSRNEKITAGGLGLTVTLWIFGSQLGVNAVAAALLGLAILLITNVVSAPPEVYCGRTQVNKDSCVLFLYRLCL